MKRSVDLLLRVFLPLVGLPHGVTGCRPPEVRPSPPPCGWSIGFMVTPRLCGRRPSQRERPALAIVVFMWSGFDTEPMVAKHCPCTRRCSPEFRRSDHITLIAAHDLRESPGRSGDGPALADFHFDIMDDRADRNIGRRHRIARLHVDLLAGDHFVADGEPLRRENIGQLAIRIADQRDKGGAIGIVFEPFDLGRHVELATLEVDDAIGLLMAAATKAHGDAAMVVAAALRRLTFGQRLHRLAFIEVLAVHDHELAKARRDRLECLQRHVLVLEPSLRVPSSRRSYGLRRASRPPSSRRSACRARRERPSSCPCAPGC